MKQIIPFNKEIEFKTEIGKIVSISLEHTLSLTQDYLISGDFLITGSYTMTEASQIPEDFSYKIPVEINIAHKYTLNNINIDIDDFIYDINGNKLIVNIQLLLDNLESNDELETVETLFNDEESIPTYNYDIEDDKIRNDIKDNDHDMKTDEEIIEDLFLNLEEKEEIEIPINNMNNSLLNSKIEDPKQKELPKEDNDTNVESIFSALKNTDETFSTYRIYIMREQDDIESILSKYNLTKEELQEYNNLSELKVGSKVIIPSNKNE